MKWLFLDYSVLAVSISAFFKKFWQKYGSTLELSILEEVFSTFLQLAGAWRVCVCEGTCVVEGNSTHVLLGD